MNRIPLVPIDLAEPKEVVAAIRERRGGVLSNLDRILLNSPTAASAWNAFLGTVRQRLSLRPTVREIVMCVVAIHNKAEYEYVHHSREFLAAGGSAEQIKAMDNPMQASMNEVLFDPQERVAFQITLEMTRDIQIADETLAKAKRVFNNEELIDLMVTVGAYNMVSRIVVACDIQPEKH
jgi:alkylhydroperoxidase family enzyme